MSNLIERLRTEPFNHWELRHEAADEIERLTALRKEDREDMQRLSDQVDYLSDENAKLQAESEATGRIVLAAIKWRADLRRDTVYEYELDLLDALDAFAALEDE